MKFFAAIMALATVQAEMTNDEKLHMFDFDNAKMLWKNDWEYYRSVHGSDTDDNNCRLAESDNFLGAQQCKFSWECRGARTCERGGWCSGYDGCLETPLPNQAPGLEPDH